MVTPILSGVSVLMVVSGALGTWQISRREERLKPYARVVYWGTPALAVLVFVAMLIFGGGALGPDWSSLTGAAPERSAPAPTEYVPPEDLPR
jgi:hypothetical protein